MPAWAAFESALSDVTAGRVSQALPALAKVTAAYPDSPIFAATYARALASSGRKPQAIARFRDAVKRWPTDWSLYHELAVIARDLGHADEAMRGEEAAVALNPREPSVLNGKGLLLSDAGRNREASEAFEAALSTIRPTRCMRRILATRAALLMISTAPRPPTARLGARAIARCREWVRRVLVQQRHTRPRCRGSNRQRAIRSSSRRN